MARAFSDDLRCRILRAYERGGVSLRELAERFGVSWEYVRKIRKQQLRTGRMGHWRTLTLLAALTIGGLRAPMTIESPTDGDVFMAYLEQVLGPQLQPGQVVIMDNLSAHKVAGVRSLIEACGARLLYLPPYSPDFNPIKQAWSKLKELLRAAKARLLEALEAAIAPELAAVTTDNALAWFRHCGYGVHQL